MLQFLRTYAVGLVAATLSSATLIVCHVFGFHPEKYLAFGALKMIANSQAFQWGAVLIFFLIVTGAVQLGIWFGRRPAARLPIGGYLIADGLSPRTPDGAIPMFCRIEHATKLLRWHPYPPGSKSDPHGDQYTNTFSHLRGKLESVPPGNYSVAPMRLGNYEIDFTGDDSGWSESISLRDVNGRLVQTIRLTKGAKVVLEKTYE